MLNTKPVGERLLADIQGLQLLLLQHPALYNEYVIGAQPLSPLPYHNTPEILSFKGFYHSLVRDCYLVSNLCPDNQSLRHKLPTSLYSNVNDLLDVALECLRQSVHINEANQF